MSRWSAWGAVFASLAGTCTGPVQALSFLPWEGVQTTFEVVEHGGLARRVGYMHPPGGDRGAPVVIVLHYNEGTAPAMANLTEAGILARDHGVLVVLPEAEDGTWSHNPQEVGGQDDVGFLDALIDRLVGVYGVDGRRIYMTGYSQGANMGVRFACEHPEKIAGVASVAGLMRRALANQCAPGLGTPIMFMHGTADNQVSYEPGTGDIGDLTFTSHLSAKATVEFWAAVGGCGTTPRHRDLPDLVNDRTRVSLDSYGPCAGGGEVELYTIRNGGHSWPGALDFIPRTGLTTQDVKATLAAWQFFSRFARP